jgi:hypothetical protein
MLAVGLLVTAAGLVTIGFGIPINAFSLGNTLIVAGTVGVAAGLVLIGLAAAIGQLRKIADALAVRPAAVRPARTAESAESAPQQPAVRQTPAAPMSAPTRVPGAAQEAAQPEPRFPASAPSEPTGPLDWLRARPKSATAGGAPPVEPPVVEVNDDAPLSPRSPQRQSEPDPRVWSPNRPAAAEARPAPRTEQPMPRATPQPPEPPKPDFDLVWPDRSGPSGEPARREEPGMPPRPRDARTPERRPEAPKEAPREAAREAPKPPAERGPAILKSGVIDGMPYTLYADGSIEAELPSGTVKFASVDALRAHLEKQN